jgi:chromosome segregation ATPase
MKKNGNGYEAAPRDLTRKNESSDEDTAELPVLTLDGPDDGTEPAIPTLKPEELIQPPEEALQPAQEGADSTGEMVASSWVSGMEAEIQWLQERWRTLDRELRRSEERGAKFRTESEEKDQVIADLNTQLAEQLGRIEKLSSTILERETSVASLEAERAKQNTRLAEQLDELNNARGQAAVLEDRLQAALKEREDLNGRMSDERARLTEISVRNEAIAATNQRLSTRVQDLEAYIEGRKDKWSTLNNELESHKAKLTELEDTIAAGAKRLEEREARIESLGERIIELERLRSEAEGRHKERDSAYQETQVRLTEQAAEIERLHAAANRRDDGAQLAGDTVEKHKAEVDGLTQALAERDETIKKLEAALGSSDALKNHMEEEIAEDRKRIGELQRELAQLGAERDRLSDGYTEAGTEIEALLERLADAEAVVAELKEENEGSEARIAELEADVAEKQKVIHAIDRNAKRLVALRQNLNSLSTDHTAGAAPEDAATAVSAPKEADTTDEPVQRMIVSLDVDTSAQTEYSLSKPVMTIGRAKASDIRIIDAVVSRVHARLTTDEDATIIEDMGSKNGVLVNSHPVDRAVLHHGDVISLGANHDFRYVEIGHATH